ncbi:MAG: hypothetical protein R3B40_23820 [Polyangiales bacterium]|nr:hypothetical protein [Sandaracinaceae bacterium]
MSDPHAARPVPRFDLRLQRGVARLVSRSPLSVRLGSVDGLELVAGDLEGTLDLRQGALLFRDRRTHASRGTFSLDVSRVERALEALGISLRVHPGVPVERGEGAPSEAAARSPVTLPAPPTRASVARANDASGLVHASDATAFGVTLRTREGPIDCVAQARLVSDRLHVRLSGFVTLLPCDERAHVARDALRPLERAVRFATVELLLQGAGQWLELVVHDAVAALLTEPFASAGWRLPRTRGLLGTACLRAADARGRASIVLVAASDPADAHAPRPVHAELDGSSVDDSAARVRDEAREALGRALTETMRARDPDAGLHALLERYVAHEPSTVMRAHALLTVAETTLSTGPTSSSSAAVLGLALRALGNDADSPHTARRVLELAHRLPAIEDERLLAAVLAARLPAAQQAALVLEAFPRVLDASAVRARAWLARVRPFVTDAAGLRAAEAALQAAEAASATPLEPPGQTEERAAEALAEAGRFADAAAAFARAARAYQQGRQALAAARCWVACVSSVRPDALVLEWVVPGAFALHLSGRTQDAIALLATLLSREAGPHAREPLDHALESAVRFHEALPSPMGSPELFAARRRELSAPS